MLAFYCAPRSIFWTSRPSLYAPLLEEPKLATQHPVLGFERPPGSDREHGQGDKVGQRSQNNLTENDHAQIMP
jgi:hypothetical protein